MSWTALHTIIGEVFVKGKASELEPVRVGSFYCFVGNMDGKEVFVNPGLVACMEEVPDADLCRCGSCGWFGRRAFVHPVFDDGGCPECYARDIREAERWS